jgi:hypothetical protein
MQDFVKFAFDPLFQLFCAKPNKEIEFEWLIDLSHFLLILAASSNTLILSLKVRSSRDSSVRLLLEAKF